MIIFLLRAFTPRIIFLVVLGIALLREALRLGKALTDVSVPSLLQSSRVPVRHWLWQVPGSIALLGFMLRADWWWSMPISMSALITSVLIYKGRERTSLLCLAILTGSVLVTVGCLASIGLRSDLWWISYNNDDDPWFHIISRGLIEWGPFTRPDVASNHGASAAAYHLLAYFLTGILNLAWPSEPMFVLSRVLPVVTALVAMCSIHFFLSVFAKLSKTSARSNPSRFWVAGIFCVAVVISGIPSDFLGAALLIGFIALAPTISSERGAIRYSLLSLLATATVAFSKGPYLYAITLMLVFAVIASKRKLIVIVAPLASSALVYLFFRQNSMSASIGIGFFSPESLGEHAAAGGYPARGLAILYVVTPIALGLVASFVLCSQPRSTREARVIAIGLTAVSIAAALSRLFVHADPRGHMYLFQPGVIASGLLVALCVEHEMDRRPMRLKLLYVLGAFLSLLWYLLVPVLVPNLNSGSVGAKFLRMVRDASILNLALLIFTALLVSSHFVSHKKGQDFQLTKMFAALPQFAALLLVATSIPFALSRFEHRYNETQSGEEDAWRNGVIGDADAREVSLVLKRENSRDELVAYTMCGDDLKQGCIAPLVFAAYSEARFLSLISDPPEYWDFANEAARRDYEFSSSLLARPPNEAIRALRQRGVSLLIVNKSRSGEQWRLDKLRDIAKVIFSNDSYALLRLTTEPSQ